jgi:hypothetical protein
MSDDDYGPLVEDESVTGGQDEDGRDVIRPKKPGGLQEDARFRPTDPRERRNKRDA